MGMFFKATCDRCWDSVDVCTCTEQEIHEHDIYSKAYRSGRAQGRFNGIGEAQRLLALSKDVPHEVKIILWEQLEKLKNQK